MNKYTWFVTWFVTSIATGLATPPAIAQELQVLEEVIVTAQRREQSLQDVPISLTAFTGAELVQNNIREAKDYLMFAPNVNFTEDGETGERSVGIAIRGISDFANALTNVGGLNSSFGIYLDEVNIANTANKVANPKLFDLERVEVLRGPQGTYFGRNATGGALNLTTKLPTNKYEYELGGGYARFSTWNIDFMTNFPVTDSFFVRAAASYEKSANFIKNLSQTGNDAGYDHFSGRVAARWLVNDRFTADFSVMKTRENDGADTNVNSGVFDSDTIGATPSLLPVNPDGTLDTSPVSPATIYVPFADLAPIDSGRGFYPENDRYINKDFNEANEGRATILNARLNYDGEGWSLRSITGYVDTVGRRRFDQDVTQLALYETHNARFTEGFSQELRLRVEREAWDLTIGGIYARDNFDQVNFSPIGLSGFRIATLNPDGTIDTCLFCLEPGEIISQPRYSTFDSTSFALFADANWHVTDQLTATIGARYTDDEIESVEYRNFTTSLDDAFENNAPPASELTNQGKETFSDVSPRFVLSYAASEDINTYASVSKGYKPGGLILGNFNTPTGSELRATPYLEEEVWNYELGTKLEAFNRRLQVNAAVFYIDISDLQVPTVDVELVGTQVINNTQIINTDAEAKGAELELHALPIENVFVGMGIGYLDAEFVGFDETDPYIFENMGFALKGEQLPRAPEWTLNLVGQYDFRVTDTLDSFVRLEWTYRSKTTSDIEAITTQIEPLDNETAQDFGLDTEFGGDGFENGVFIPWPRDPFPFVVPSFDVVNLRAGIAGERWSITAYAENLLDDQYYTGTQENFSLGGIRLRPHHRIVGINFQLLSE